MLEGYLIDVAEKEMFIVLFVCLFVFRQINVYSFLFACFSQPCLYCFGNSVPGKSK